MKFFSLSILVVFAILGFTLSQFGSVVGQGFGFGGGAGGGGAGGGIFGILIFLFVFIVIIQLLFPTRTTIAPTTAAPGTTTQAMITVPVVGSKK